MKERDLHMLDLTHQGLFSERAGALFRILTEETGPIDLGMALGCHPVNGHICMIIKLGDYFATAFTSQEAKALVEVIETTSRAEEPPTKKLKDIFSYLVENCSELASEIDELERAAQQRQLN